jgi:hypothetical protein
MKAPPMNLIIALGLIEVGGGITRQESKLYVL